MSGLVGRKMAMMKVVRRLGQREVEMMKMVPGILGLDLEEGNLGQSLLEGLRILGLD